MALGCEFAAHWQVEVIGMPARPLMVELAEISRFCRARFPDHYSWVTVDRAARRFTVRRVPSAELDEAVRAAFADLDVEFADASHSAAERAAARQTVRDLQPEWSARGVVFNGITCEPDGSAVLVYVDGDEAAIARLDATLRPLPVRLLRTTVVLL